MHINTNNDQNSWFGTHGEKQMDAEGFEISLEEILGRDAPRGCNVMEGKTAKRLPNPTWSHVRSSLAAWPLLFGVILLWHPAMGLTTLAEERDEFMTYRILLALERRLAQRSVKGWGAQMGRVGRDKVNHAMKGINLQTLAKTSSSSSSSSSSAQETPTCQVRVWIRAPWDCQRYWSSELRWRSSVWMRPWGPTRADQPLDPTTGRMCWSCVAQHMWRTFSCIDLDLSFFCKDQSNFGVDLWGPGNKCKMHWLLVIFRLIHIQDCPQSFWHVQFRCGWNLGTTRIFPDSSICGCPNFDPCALDPLEPTILVTSQEELQRRLQFALSDPHFSPRFLAMNAALLPHLWRNSHQPQPAQIGDLGDGGRWDLELAAKTQELLEEETKVAPVATTGFGPLTMLADQVPHFFSPVVWDLVPMVSCWVLNPSCYWGLSSNRRCGDCCLKLTVKRGLFSMSLQVWNSSMNDCGNSRKSHCQFGQLFCWCTLHVHCWFLWSFQLPLIYTGCSLVHKCHCHSWLTRKKKTWGKKILPGILLVRLPWESWLTSFHILIAMNMPLCSMGLENVKQCKNNAIQSHFLLTHREDAAPLELFGSSSCGPSNSRKP